MSWLLRGWHAPSLDRFLRRGGGLVVLAALSFAAGWLLPDPATLRAYLDDTSAPCFRIAWVARITTGEAGEPGPILLVQTEWNRDMTAPVGGAANSCRSSNVRLRLPPVTESIYRREDGRLVPVGEFARRRSPRLPIPPELCLPVPVGSAAHPCQEPK